MSGPVFMKIVGTKEPEFTADCSKEDSIGGHKWDEEDARADMITVLSFNQNVLQETNKLTGAPTGQRYVGEITITKFIDKSTPLLYQAATTSELLPEAELQFFRNNDDKPDDPYYKIELEELVVTEVQTFMNDDQVQGNEGLDPMEKVSFRFKTITWSHEGASSSATYTHGKVTE